MLAGLDRGLSVAMPRGVFLSSTRATAMEQMDSAMLVHPGHVALVDGFGNLVIAVGGSGMSRLPLVPEDASPEVSAAYAEIVKSRGRVLNVFSVLGHAPEGLRRLAAVGEYVRFQTQLPNRLRELLILATASQNRCQYEWTQHVPLARKAGVSDAEIEALGDRRVPDDLSPLERAAVRYVQELARERRVSDATFAELRAHCDAREITDLTLLAGFYTALGLALNAFDVDLEPGQAPLLR